MCRAKCLRMSTWRLHGALSGRGATPHGAFSARSEPEAREAHEAHEEGAQGHHRRSNVSRHDPGTSESGQEVPGIRMSRRFAMLSPPDPPGTVLAALLLDHPESGPHPTPPSG